MLISIEKCEYASGQDAIVIDVSPAHMRSDTGCSSSWRQ